VTGSGSREPWTEGRIRRELAEFVEGATEWPSYRDFQRDGRQRLRDQVTRYGGARLWAERLGLEYPERRPGYAARWTEARVRAGLSEFLRGCERWPTRLEFEAAGRKPLRDAVGRLGGVEHWAVEFGLPLASMRSGSIRWWTPERIELELRNALAGSDTWPSRRELQRRGKPGLAGAVYHHGGAGYWARRLGIRREVRQVGHEGPRVWTTERILSELEEFCRDRETWPTEREFVNAGRARLYNAICHHGGPRTWAARLGVPPGPRG
jgi:hypothetical protein